MMMESWGRICTCSNPTFMASALPDRIYSCGKCHGAISVDKLMEHVKDSMRECKEDSMRECKEDLKNNLNSDLDCMDDVLNEAKELLDD